MEWTCREAGRVPTYGQTRGVSHAEVKGQFVRKHVPLDGKEISSRVEWLTR